jgi:uncharacterized membrane protein
VSRDWRRHSISLKTIDVPGATATAANGNSTHEIAGQFRGADGNFHGFVLNKGVFTPIDVPGAVATVVPPDTIVTIINGINAPGRFTGTYGDGSTVPAVVWSKSDFTTLDPPGATRSQAGFLNAQGQVVGTYRDAAQKRHGFIWRKGTFTTFNAPNDHPLFGTVAFGINDIGQVVGNFVDIKGNNAHRHGFVRSSDGVFTTLDVTDMDFTSPQGINNAGQIVGFYANNADPLFLFHGFVVSNGDFATGDFATVDVPGARETQIFSINAKGEIVGKYVDADDVQHGFMGTPVR